MASERQEYVEIALWITSDQSPPETISDALGIDPTRVRLRGTPTKTGVMRQPQFDINEWELSERLYAKQHDYIGSHIEGFFTDFIGRLKPLAAKIMQLSKQASVSIGIVYSVRQMPYIGLTSNQVQAIAALGARVDFEIMVYADESGRKDA